MRIKSGFILKEIAGEYLAIPFDESYEKFGAMVSLNDTGAFLWELLEEEHSAGELAAALCEAYGIEHSLADRAVAAFLNTLREKSLLEEPA